MRGPPLKHFFLLLATLFGCGESPAPGVGGDPESVREMDGDTLVVRTISGSTWGREGTLVPEISIGTLEGDERYVFGRIRSLAVDEESRILVVDGLIPGLRVYAPDGSYLETWGREGQGPGEFRNPDAGLTILSDGRVVVRDPGNARFQVYSGGGEALESWPVINGQYRTRLPFYRLADTILTPHVVNIAGEIETWRLGLIRVSPTGEIIDTLAVPETGRDAPILRARSGGNNAETPVPWAPMEQWAWHSDGYFVHGFSDEYSFSLLRTEEPLRIERFVDPVAITDSEREEQEERVTRGMQWLDPNWRWNGPQIPRNKPAFSGLFVGTDGRIWVLRDGPAYEVEDFDFDPTDPDDVEINWEQDRSFDVFEPDGSFLGTVSIPRDMGTSPTPLFGTEFVWAVTRDDTDVQRIVRYRIQGPPS